MRSRRLTLRTIARRALALVAAGVLVGSCVRLVPPAGDVPPPAATAAMAGVRVGPPVDRLGLGAPAAARALASFIESCPRLLTRPDASGLTTPDDWRPACTAAGTWSGMAPQLFFAQYFEAVEIGDGAAFVTGYYEPEIAGSRERRPGYQAPVYGLPPDLVRGWPDDVPEAERTGRPPLGRIDAQGRFVRYYERAEIEDGALAGRGLEIAWAADPIELFFLQIQGSGRLRLPDGSVMRIGYAGQNGREYVGIGKLLRDRGVLEPGQASMQGIMAWLRAHPEEGREVMRTNKSWVFFRELTGDGPLGALNVPVRPQASVAADPAFVPLGAPVWLDVDRHEANGLWVAQDTGGAIKGANRFDSFWGAGEAARTIAGGMSSRGRALLLLPKGVAARHQRR